MRSFLTVLSVSLLVALSSAEYSLETTELETFVINLDLPPEQRFVEVVDHFREPIEFIFNFYLAIAPQFLENIFEKLEPFMKATQYEHYMEVQGVADTLGVDLNEALFVNYIYELQAYCTSIVARSADGTIMHGRNLDFQMADRMRAITFNAEYQKDGKTLFHAVQFAGTIGIYTGMRDGAFSVSENNRYSDITLEKILENFELIFEGYNEVSWLLRDTLTTCDNFECALNSFITSPIITPAYLIVAGVEANEGAVISRNRNGAAHIEMLTADRWYVAQTNDDHFTGKCQTRCQAARENMELLGQEGLTKDRFRDEIMFVGPTMNVETIFNAMMVPGAQVMESQGTDSDYPKYS